MEVMNTRLQLGVSTSALNKHIREMFVLDNNNKKTVFFEAVRVGEPAPSLRGVQHLVQPRNA